MLMKSPLPNKKTPVTCLAHNIDSDYVQINSTVCVLLDEEEFTVEML